MLNKPKVEMLDFALTGDVTSTSGSAATTVAKIQGNPVANTAPSAGQTLVWDGTSWTPSTPSAGGGGGANGLTYYLDFGTAADTPTTNLPGTPKMLGRTGSASASSVTSPTLALDTWTLIAGFVSESAPQDPAVLSIPGGLWDFNVWAYGDANSQSPTSIRAKVYVYDGTNAPTLIATSSAQTINSVSAQFSIAALVVQTTITATDRIYVEIEARATASNHTVTLQFGDGQPSHVHTSLPLVGGTGLWKNVAGVLQSPASLLTNADVASDAAIDVSKLSGAAKTTVVQVFTTVGTSTWIKPAGAKQICVELCSGGNGGGAGGKGTSGTAIYGGSGGGGGGYSRTFISAADLTESTYTITVGSGGTGAIFGGANATQGGVSGFSLGSNPSVFFARAGSGGTPGQNGGTTLPTTGTGGSPNSNAGGTPSIAGTAGAGAGAANAPTGGGAGGGISAAGAPYNGGAGATNQVVNIASAGGGQSSTANGGNGVTSTPRTATSLVINGNGGGGGGASTFATGSGGNGGNGSGYGSGGGGGGATIGSGNGGNGGNGAPGVVIVTTYF